MTVEFVRTGDGSDTLYRRDLNQHYHSTFGAIQESRHIFIDTGFHHALKQPGRDIRVALHSIRILEVGFGTGLNALLTHTEAEKLGVRVHYTALEPFPLEPASWMALNYPSLCNGDANPDIFSKLHLLAWNQEGQVSPRFSIQKFDKLLQAYLPPPSGFDLVYFDAFGPDAQPELWTESIFKMLWGGMASGGILVTYSVKGDVVRAMKASGFITEKLPGPPGKRHILRAVKI